MTGRAALVLAVTLAVGACGARVAPRVAPQVARADGPRPEGRELPVAAPRTIEETSPELRAALAALASGETPARLRHVAAEYHRLRVFDSAEAYLVRALKLEPQSAESFELRARVYRDWGVLDGALGDATRATYYAPKSASAQNTLGTVLFVLGREDEAEAAFNRALALDASAAWAASNLCYLALTQGDAERAVAQCERALAADPSFAPARNNLALTHAAAGRVDEARREFLGAGSKAVGLYNVGIIHLARGDYESAIAAFDAAQREAPGFDAAFIRAQEARRLAARKN